MKDNFKDSGMFAKHGETFDKDGRLHSFNGKPAVVEVDGREWYNHGVKLYAVDLLGTKYWFRKGKYHRTGDKPAILWKDGSEEYYKNGKLHRVGDKPAKISLGYGKDEYWYKDGKQHRGGDKPAIVSEDGDRVWYKNGIAHREGDKPTLISPSGRLGFTKSYKKHGKLHREGDKPAKYLNDGSFEYWKNGKQYYLKKK